MSRGRPFLRFPSPQKQISAQLHNVLFSRPLRSQCSSLVTSYLKRNQNIILLYKNYCINVTKLFFQKIWYFYCRYYYKINELFIVYDQLFIATPFMQHREFFEYCAMFFLPFGNIAKTRRVFNHFENVLEYLFRGFFLIFKDYPLWIILELFQIIHY